MESSDGKVMPQRPSTMAVFGARVLAVVSWIFGGLWILAGVTGVLVGDYTEAGIVLTIGVLILIFGTWRRRQQRRIIRMYENGHVSHPPGGTSPTRKPDTTVDAKKAVWDVVDELVAIHGSTLVSKRRKTLYYDDYGREITDDWVTELYYFYDNIVDPALVTRGLRKQMEAMESDYAQNHSEDEHVQQFLESHGSISGYSQLAILFRIAEVVEYLDSGIEPHQPDVSEMSPSEFERHCADVLKAAGWDTRVVAGPGDQGVDVVASRGDKVAVFQCKLYQSPVGNKPVQEVHAGRLFYDADVAAVVTNAEYTTGARIAAKQTGVLLIHDMDLHEFTPDTLLPKDTRSTGTGDKETTNEQTSEG